MHKNLILFILIISPLLQSLANEINAPLIFDESKELGKRKNILIFGAGYVGCVTGACLSMLGHEITFIDPDSNKIALLNRGKSPILEPHLEELITQGVASQLIHSQVTVGSCLLDADIAIIAIQTPTSSDGVPQTEYIEKALISLKQATMTRTKSLIVSIRSTVPPLLIRQLYENHLKGANLNIALVANPEFLRESTAVYDFLHPPFCIVGGDDKHAVETILSLYASITPKCIATSLEVACMLKYACNAFHAMKVAFANEMSSICKSMHVNSDEMMTIFRQDEVLNCSSAYLKPGFSFGGSCLIKDLQALVSIGNSYHSDLPLLSATLPSNQAHFQRKAQEIIDGNHHNIAVLGVTFKRNSDDLRGSPFLQLVHYLINQSIHLKIYDPDLTDTSRKQLKDLLLLVYDDLGTLLEECDAIVLCKNLLSAETLQNLRNANISIYNLSYNGDVPP